MWHCVSLLLLVWLPLWCLRFFGRPSFLLYLQHRYGLQVSYHLCQLSTTYGISVLVACAQPRRLLRWWFGAGLAVVAAGACAAVGALFVNFLRLAASQRSPDPPIPGLQAATPWPRPYHRPRPPPRPPIPPSAPPLSTTPVPAVPPCTSSSALLIPVIPGVTVPLEYTGYLAAALVVAIVVHELGHALAALAEDIPVHRCGLAVLLLLPGAFVQLDDMVKFLPPLRQIRIYAAGPWHNLVLWFLCSAGHAMTPGLLRPLWATCARHHGSPCVWITGATPGHPLASLVARSGEPLALRRVNGQPVGSTEQWVALLAGHYTAPDAAATYCVPATLLHSALSGEECCAPHYNGTAGCFHELPATTSGGQPVGLPKKSLFVPEHSICLPGRLVASQFTSNCTRACVGRGAACSPRWLRYAGAGEAQLFHFEWQDGRASTLSDHPMALLSEVQVGEYSVLGHSVASHALRRTLGDEFPKRLQLLLQLTGALSLGLALLNMVPVPLLDGEKCVKPALFLLGELYRRWVEDPQRLPPVPDDQFSSPTTIVLDAAQGTYRVVPLVADDDGFSPERYTRRQERIHTLVVRGCTGLVLANVFFGVLHAIG